MTQVLSPCAGRVLTLAYVDDPVFSSQMLGPGVAVDPDPGHQTVTAPLAGRLVKVHPHAFVVLAPDGVGILVHLGINTVKLGGAGFTVHASEGEDVSPGDAVVSWDPAVADASGMSAVVPVVVMDRRPDTLTDIAPTGVVTAGDVLFTA